MQQLWRTLLAVLFPLDRLVRVLGILLEGLDYLDGLFADPEDTPESRRLIEGAIIFFEHWVNLLTAIRAADMLGLPHPKWDAPLHIWQPHTPRSWDDLIKRYTRMRLSFATIERHARRRAARFKRERSDSPLRLAPSAQSTSPMLRMVEDAVVMLEVLHRRRRGRWIARPCAQDGGGERRRRRRDLIQWIKSRSERLSASEGRVLPRGPPQTPTADCPFPIAPEAPASEVAPIYAHRTRSSHFRPRTALHKHIHAHLPGSNRGWLGVYARPAV